MIKLLTPNDNGLFNEKVVKGKTKQELAWENCKLQIGDYQVEDITPKFKDWTYFDYLEEYKKTGFVRFIEPMGALEVEGYGEQAVNFPDEIAELKRDGHRALCFLGTDSNRLFSRRISKTTGWYGENTDQLPHLREMILPGYEGTVIDGEICRDGETSKELQSVMGALPAKAIQDQFVKGFVDYDLFDILYYKGVNIQAMPLWKRKLYLWDVIFAFWLAYGEDCHVNYLTTLITPESASILDTMRKYAHSKDLTQIPRDLVKTVPSFIEHFLEITKDDEEEGLVVKNANATYQAGKKSKDFIKLKKHDTWDVIMTGIEPSTRLYSGKELEKWQFWEKKNGQKVKGNYYPKYAGGMEIEPVTKPYFMGWCGGITGAVWKPLDWDKWIDENGGEIHAEAYLDQAHDEGWVKFANGELHQLFEVVTVKGLTEEQQEDILNNGAQYMDEKRVFEVEAQEIIDKEKGTLRHPRFYMWRDNKSHDMCTWNAHLRVEEN